MNPMTDRKFQHNPVWTWLSTSSSLKESSTRARDLVIHRYAEYRDFHEIILQALVPVTIEVMRRLTAIFLSHSGTQDPILDVQSLALWH